MYRWKTFAEELPEPGRSINLELNSSRSYYVGHRQEFVLGDGWCVWVLGGPTIRPQNSEGWEWVYIPPPRNPQGITPSRFQEAQEELVARHLFSRIAAGTCRPIALSVCHIPANELFPPISPDEIDGLFRAADWCAGWIKGQWSPPAGWTGEHLPASALVLAIEAYQAQESSAIFSPLLRRLKEAAAEEKKPWLVGER